MTSGLSRLHPHLQHAIVHDLGWRDLRPVQTLTLEAVLDGCNTVVLAPTAGGKTEASFFPVLSRILSDGLSPVAALYICPIRALLNNLEPRLARYARMVGLEVFKWHGDVSDYQKQRFRHEPKHILLTTPESLEVMFISARTDARALFASLSMVVIDEVHAFAGDDRGAHLASILERLTRLCGQDLQRIGLSATVGNPEVIGQWLQGSSQRPARVVDPPRPPAARALHLDFCEELELAAHDIGRQARGHKSLIFVESRSKAERVAHALSSSQVEVFIHHSSVSRADRAQAEARFADGENTAIVCTSTMELGIDVGDLDQVVQVDAPSTVASFLQRLGRTGRRPGTRASCAFYCLTPETLLQAAAMLRLASRGWIESVAPPRRALHVLAHQVMSLILQEGGISRHRVLPWLAAAWPFAGLTSQDLTRLVDTMVARDILYEADGLLTLGTEGEQRYGRRNFFELYAVFSSPPVFRVQYRREEVGHVDASFVQAHDQEEGPLCFRLAGRPWQVEHVDWGRGVLSVKPAEYGRIPSWLGPAGTLSYALCQEMLGTLLEPGEEQQWLSRGARLELEALREGYAGLLEPGTAPMEESDGHVQWHTFAGAAINRLLAAGLEAQTGAHWVAGNLSMRAKDVPLTQAREAILGLRGLDLPTLAGTAAGKMARGPVSKFQACLPEEAEAQLLADKLLDVAGAEAFVARVKVVG